MMFLATIWKHTGWKAVVTLLVIIGIALLFLLQGCATTQSRKDAPEEVISEDPDYTWDGELDPHEFNNETKWTYAGTLQQDYSTVWVILANVDTASPIDHVALLTDAYGNVLAYRYFKLNEPHVFSFDTDKLHYREYTYTEAQKQECFTCHADRVAEEVKPI